jgi:hypothetical protein
LGEAVDKLTRETERERPPPEDEALARAEATVAAAAAERRRSEALRREVDDRLEQTRQQILAATENR